MPPTHAILLLLALGSVAAGCSESARSPATHLVLTGPRLEPAGGARRVLDLEFTRDDPVRWSGIPDGDAVVPYDGRVFFRGPATNHTIRCELLDPVAATDVELRAKSAKGAGLAIHWWTDAGRGTARARIAGGDAWRTVSCPVAASGPIHALSVQVETRDGLLALERVSLTETPASVRIARLDDTAARPLTLDAVRRRGRPLTPARPLGLAGAELRRGDVVETAVGVLPPDVLDDPGDRREPLVVELTGPEPPLRFAVPDEAGWHRATFELERDVDGEAALRLAGGPDDAVLVALPRLRRGPPPPGPSVLLVTADTLRGDVLGCYGDPVTQTPHLDRLAAEGVRFDDVTTCVNSTCPSHASILTSLYPKDHGVPNNQHRLPDRVVTLAEILRAQGYDTAAAIGSAVLRPRVSGLAQGFDVFFGTDAAKRPASEVNADVLPWLERRGGRPFFLWVHYYDPHTPYRPPDEALRPYAAPREPSPDHDALVADPAYGRALYRAEATTMDAAIGALLARLDELELRDTTLVAFTSDHGESLGEHDIWYSHRGLYAETVRVPWIVRAPGGPRGVVVSRPAETVDVAPTILDHLGLEAPPGMRGTVQALADDGASTARTQYFEHASSTAVGLRRDRWYAILSRTKDRRLELYERSRDPALSTDVAARHPDVAERIRAHLEAWLEDRRGLEAEAADLGAEHLRVLSELGYTK